MTIMGGRKNGLAGTFALDHIASDGGTGSILNTGSGTLTITGGNYVGSYALSSCAYGTGSVSTISNVGSGDIIFKSGSAGTSMYAHANGGTGIISNLGSGNVIIKNDSPSGIEGYTAAIQINCRDGGTAILSNQGTGDLIISGGSAKSAYGMATNASGGTSSISNTDSGTITITGGSGTYSYGMETNARTKSTISNERDGNLNILGGTGESAYGIRINVYNGDGKIINSGSGTLTISGGSGQGAAAIQINTHGKAPTSTISNDGNGTLIISGGSASKAHGIANNTGRLRAVSVISNTGSGTLTISGGSKTDAYGIYSFSAYSGNKGIISNAENGTLNILGQIDAGSYGIWNLTKDSGSIGQIENAGVMNLNKNSIETFGVGDPLVTNKSSGKVFAEAGALFTGEYETTPGDPVIKPIDMVVWDGTKINTVRSDIYTAVSGGGMTIGTVTLKDDWKKYSVWEAGGVITFTDVVDGSDVANQIRQQFEAAFGTGTTIRFTGTGSGETPSGNTLFNTDVVNDLLNNGKLAEGGVVTSEALNMGNSALTIGSADATFTQNIGFKGVDDASSITVKDGKTLTLTGAQASMTLALRTNENERASYVITEKETTLTNGQLKLGIAELSATQGILADVTADSSSAVVAEHGVFEISSVKGNGHVVVKEDSALTVGSLSAATTTNAGELTVNSDVVLKRPTTVNPFATDGKAPAKPVAFLNDKGAVANLQNITIEAGASIENKKDATLNAGTVTVGAGSLLWNYTGGKMSFDSLIVQGSIRDYGTLTVSDTLAVAKGGRYDYDGKVRVGNAMMVEEGGELTMSGDSTLSRLVVGGDAVSAKILAASDSSDETPDAVLKVLDGEHYLETLELTSGTVNVAEDATLAGKTLEGGAIGSKVTVEEGAVLAFSHDKNSLKSVMDNYKGGKLGWDDKTKLALSQALHFKDEGSLSVGRTDAEGTVNLGSDALVLLGTTNLHGEAVFNGKGGDTLSVEEGAVLAVTDDFMWGNHYLAKGFDAASEESLKNLAIFDKEGKKLDVFTNEKGAHITIGSDDIADKDTNYRLQKNINVVLDGMQDQESEVADVRVLTKLVLAGNGAAQSARLSSMTAEAGILTENVRLAQDAFDTIIDHASTMRAKRGTVWAEGIYSKADVSGMKAENRRVGYESDATGFAMGGDWSASGWHLGAAFSAQKGDLQGTESATSNVIDSYGVSLYGRKDFASGLTLTAGMTYSFGANEVVQQNVETLKADVDTNVLIAGGRVSYPIALNGFFVTPYARIEAVWSKSDAYTVTASGQDAFRFGKTNEVLGRIPLGMSASAFTPMLNGTLNVTADLSVAPQFGGKDYKQSVVGVTTGARDVTAADYADDWIGKLKLGLSYQGRQGSFDLFYEAARSDTLDAGHSFNAKAALYF